MDQTTSSAVWRQQFELRHTELDWTGRLSAVGMSRLFQETAGAHATTLGASVDVLRRDGLTWVLAKFHVRMLSRQPSWRDVIHIETWRAGIERLFAARDYRATLADGTVVAEATSYWAVFDLTERRAARIPTHIAQNYPVDFERVSLGSAGFGRMASATRVDAESEQVVHLSDLDTNGHVTNSAYMVWALDSISAEQARAEAERLTELEIVFKSEALLGDRVRCELQRDAIEGGSVYLHRLTRAGDGRELALAKTTQR